MQGNQFLGSRSEQAIKSQMRLCVARGGHVRKTCLGVSGRAEAGGTSWLRMTLSCEVFPVSYFLICVRQRLKLGVDVILQTLSWGAHRDQVSTSVTLHLTSLLLFYYSLTITYIHNMCVCIITLEIYNYLSV